MAERRNRAEISSRTEAPDAWDAGLHAESDAGPIDVGLSVEPNAVGLIIDAPGIGLLKLALDVGPDGKTRLSRASRQLSDGRDGGLVVIDESKVLQAEGEVVRLRKTYLAVKAELEEQVGLTVTERDEARDRAAILSDDKKGLVAARNQLREEVQALTEALEAGHTERSVLMGERDAARAELDRAAQEMSSGSTELQAALGEERTAREAAETQLANLEPKLSALQDAHAQAELELRALEERLAAQSAAHDDALKVLAAERELAAEEHRAQLEAALETLRSEGDEAGQLEAELESLKESAGRAIDRESQLATALDEAVRERSAAQAELTATQALSEERAAELQSAVTAQSEAQAELQALRTSAGAAFERETQLTAAVDDAARAQAETQSELQALRTSVGAVSERETQLSAAVDDATRAQAQAQTGLERLQAELASRDAAANAELESVTTARGALVVRLEESEQAREAALNELAELRAQLQAAADPGELARLQNDLAQREASLSMAVARADELQVQLSSSAAATQDESTAIAEARAVALKLKTQGDKLQAERDEARALARQLHQKLAAAKNDHEAVDLRTALDHERQLAADLVSERDQLNLRLEALGRMIDQERDGRSRALAERDEWQGRFKALAHGNVDVSQPLDFSREETRSYQLDRPTLPETPAAKAQADTDPAIKKKGS